MQTEKFIAKCLLSVEEEIRDNLTMEIHKRVFSLSKQLWIRINAYVKQTKNVVEQCVEIIKEKNKEVGNNMIPFQFKQEIKTAFQNHKRKNKVL